MRDPAVFSSQRLSEAHLHPVQPLKYTTKDTTQSETISDRITRVTADLANLEEFYKVNSSPSRYQRLESFFETETEALTQAPFEDLDQDGKIDWILLRNYLRYQVGRLRDNAEESSKVLSFLGGYFPMRLTRIIEARQRAEHVDGKQTASWLVEVMQHIETVKKRVEEKKEKDKIEPVVALRATKLLAELKQHLEEWYAFYKDYDPLFMYWISDSYPKLSIKLQELIDTIKKEAIGIEPDDTDTIIGEPIGRSGIKDALLYQMMPYTPEELIEIGKKEYAWCESEMKKAASKLGYQDWRSALEHVKTQYVEPGSQPQLVRDLTKEATTYVKKHDLVTVPQVCEESIQTFMMSPEDQKMNPFFLGGDRIIVSYPTSTMSHEQKLMSLRGNNIHFSRATVFHEMIPGHHLHMHYMSRHRPYRQTFMTPFCIEGWAFYWEVLLYASSSWHKTAENRIGMLFWRMHRCARIVFSLKYHLGEMSAQECVELLVDWVGHERATAEGEVRRSVMGDYGPLYQAGYMLGGLQLWVLRKEVVGEGKGQVGEKEFHDRFLKANQMPVELFRALIKGQELVKDGESHWKFYKELE
jgi:hypothetical protein